MADEIIVSYKAVPTGFDKVGAAVNSVTADTKELQNQIKATFADKSIEEATKALYEQGDVMGALVAKYGNATTALKAMEKELATMSALGQRGTASFNELAAATAELKDNIGDTRNEIKKMASDTRVFDTMVQGARGIAAAFSVATGLTAAFGAQSKDLEKALLKVQGAMAALQGVQELANIATEKGGIATKAYGVALQVVDKISKVTGLSMAASWALATGGITILIGAVTALYMWYVKTGEEAEAQAKKEEDRQARIKEAISKSQTEAYKKVKDVQDEFDRQQERRRKEGILNERDKNLLELQLLKEKLADSEKILNDFSFFKVFLNANDSAQYRKFLEDRVLDTKVAIKKIEDEIYRPKVSPTENVIPITTVGPLVTDEVVDMNKRNAEQMNADLKQYAFDKSLKDQDEQQKLFLQAAHQFASAFSEITNSISTIRTENLRIQSNEQYSILSTLHDKEVELAGTNAAKKKRADEKYAKEKLKIDRELAISEAKIKRDQAIADKASALFNVAINIAEAVSKYAGQGVAGYVLMGLAIALGATQTAIIAATPLPEVPKFAKGGRVIAGGRNADGHLIGRSHSDGGILIEAQGEEYIWDRETTARHGDIIEAAHKNRIEDLVFHKYVVPMLTKAKVKSESESYDDMLLRKTVERSSIQSAKFIVSGISSNIKYNSYFSNRYR